MEREGALVGHGLLVAVEVGEREGYNMERREMGEDAELRDKDGVGEDEDRKTTQGQIIEEGEVFVEAVFYLVDVVVTGDNHREDSRSSIVMGGRKA